MAEEWFDIEEQQMDEVSVKEFEGLCDKFSELKVKKANLEAEAKEVSKEISGLENKLIVFLEHYKKKRHEAAAGLLYIEETSPPQTPKLIEDKKKFFNYLKDKDLFWEYVTVNHNSLRAFYKAEKKAQGDDPFFSLPGIAAPTVIKKLKLRRRK